MQALLAANGITLHSNTKETADKSLPWGIRCTETPAGLMVNQVRRASAAAKAGISAHDVIIALDGIKADSKQLAVVLMAQSEIDCHLFRRDELMCVSVAANVASEMVDRQQDKAGTASPHKVNLKLEKLGFDKWLTPDFVKS